MKYYVAALTAFVLWGFFSIALKPLAMHPSLDILFYRVFLCAALLLLAGVLFRWKVLRENAARFMQLSLGEKRKIAFLTFAGGVLLTANWFFFIYLVNHISVKAGSLSYLVCPIVTTVLAHFILKEHLSKGQWAAVALSALACLLLSIGHFMDVVYSLIVAVSYALYLVSQRQNAGFDKFTVLTLQVVCSALILLPFFPVFSGPLYTDTTFYTLIGVIAIVFTIIPLYLNLYALQRVPSSTMGVLLYINPLMNFVVAVLYFNEAVTGVQALSYSLIAVSVVLFNREYLLSGRKPKLV